MIIIEPQNEDYCNYLSIILWPDVLQTLEPLGLYGIWNQTEFVNYGSARVREEFAYESHSYN